jgi:aminopeptidase I
MVSQAVANVEQLSERNDWNDTLVAGGKYYISRNGSSIIAFTIGSGYKSGNGVAMIAGHIDALTAKLKPISKKKTTAGYIQLGVAPFADGLSSTWWDRDLGIAGRVLVKDPKTGAIVTKLVNLARPSALTSPLLECVLMTSSRSYPDPRTAFWGRYKRQPE